MTTEEKVKAQMLERLDKRMERAYKTKQFDLAEFIGKEIVDLQEGKYRMKVKFIDWPKAEIKKEVYDYD